MKVEIAAPLAEELGLDVYDRPSVPLEELFNKHLGAPGTYRRYKNDREMLYGHIKETFLHLLFFPLRLLPFGHFAETFWNYFFTESSFYGTLDGLAFAYFDDQYIVPLREGLHGEKHLKRKVRHHESNYRSAYPFGIKPSYWLITRIIWPQFKSIRRQYLENK